MAIFRILLIIFLISFSAKAELSFSIDSEGAVKNKILFFGFESSDLDLDDDIQEILKQIRLNLQTTDLFEIIKRQAPTPTPDKPNPEVELGVESIPDFQKYTPLGISAILTAEFSYDPLRNIEIRIRLWDALDERQLFGKYYSASHDNIIKVSNIISDEIFKAITGEAIGHFSSKILYVAESGSAKKRTKKLAIMDFDGRNNKFLTDGRDLVLTPIFSKNPNEIYYLRYFKDKSQIFSLNLNNLRSKKISGFRSTTYAAATHPTKQNILLLSAIINNNSDIYELDMDTNIARRLTKNKAIDTTPSYSPDGKFITFASDRSQGQQIYVMDNKGLSVSRISHEGGAYSKPVWSPDGRLIAFTKMQGGQFHIGVMVPNGKGEKILKSGYMIEGARWSPNGRYLIYYKKLSAFGKSSMPQLYAIDVVTGHEFKLPTPAGIGASDPDWI
ncbi:MAG: PD40 domain-containing protein [Rickettsiales bacterium]|nr:PD40 domain-containing protein [Rickettsiales bacterium]